ncbi:MAG: diguanylate cyclase [Luteimonas sp.]|nr:diguanylate cyclase [Luteimonas sp.]
MTLNRRNRAVFFALLFPVLGTHLDAVHANAATWTLLALQLLVYPQLVYWRAARARDPLRAEMQNLLLDGVLFGVWVAAWGFPLWITFMLFIAACLNVVIYMGLPGFWKGLAALVGGAAVAVLVNGFDFRPETGLLTSLLCILALTLYLLFFAHGAYERGISLRDSRRQLGERLDEITALQSRLQAQALRDPLTGLYNRRYLDQALERELAACHAAGTPLSLVLIDIDHFKRVNDTYGHQAGDEMIRGLSGLLTTHVNGAGLVVCRYGGEEFLLMLPGTDIDEAAVLAEALRQSFEAMRVEADGEAMRATLSIGISGYPQHLPDPQVLVREADLALYAAKLRGRNNVVLSTDPASRTT